MDSAYDFIWKIVVGGQGGVGKTTILYRFIHNEFIEDTKLTVGVQFHTQALERQSRKISLVLWDLGGQDRFRFVQGDYIKGAGSNISYGTITFADGSTIVTRRQMTVTPTGGGSASGTLKGEIIKGTGRFEGIKGALGQKTKMLPHEKGEFGPKTISECTLTYSLPSK